MSNRDTIISAILSGQQTPTSSLLSGITDQFGIRSPDHDIHGSGNTRNSYAFEQVYGVLTPFHFPDDMNSAEHALSPIKETGGLVFPFSFGVSEGVNVSYDSVSVAQTNGQFMSYRGTNSQTLQISGAKWVCDTFDNAIYALSALHFLRAYSMMDFGKNKTGRPPSPMYFSAFGRYGYHRVPVLMTSASWAFGDDMDYVGIPEPGSVQWNNRELVTDRTFGNTENYTWLPIVFSASISLTVQHSPSYHTYSFDWDEFASGELLDRTRDGSFHGTKTNIE